MNQHNLKAFVTVAHEGNLTRAAERLFLTQSALSLQIKKLQSQLGLTLFERTPRGMRLTEAGQRLLPVAERSLQAMADFCTEAAGLHHAVSGQLRIGTILDPEFLRLGRFLSTLAQRHRALTFELKHGMSGSVARMVEEGTLDVAFTLGPPDLTALGERFHLIKLTTFSYRVIAPPGWTSRVQGKGWQVLASLPWIGTPEDSVHNQLLSQLFCAENVEQQVVARVDLEPSMMDLVRSGVGMALARHSHALHAAHTHGVVIADAVAVDASLCLVSRKDRRNDAVIKAALQAIEEAWH